jgi:hypothetical protein
MFLNRHHTAGQAGPPARLRDLKHPPIKHHRIVLIDRALMVQTEYRVEIPSSASYKSRSRLTGRDGKLAVELGDVVMAEELIGGDQGADLGTAQLLRQPSLPGAVVTCYEPTS